LQLHVHEWGDPSAPALVCLHGVTAHGRRYRRAAEERLAARWHVLAPDLRGHGHSDWEPPWDVEAHLEDLLDTFGERPAVWLGHSFGGRLLLELAARRPDLVERAVLLDPAIQVLPHVAYDLAEDERKEAAYATPEEFVRARLESGRLLHTPLDIVEEEAREHLEPLPDGRLRPRYCKSAVIVAWSEMAKPPPPPGRLAAEALLVVGDRSWLLTDEQVELYEAALGPRLATVTVPGGHTVLWDAYSETLDAIEAFLA
jgi:lipase